MPTARCYECATCGGVVRETARICRYCGSDVATVRCARCFMMNVVEAIHCIGCGTELGLRPLPAPQGETLTCPRCKTQPLDAFLSDDTKVYDCGRCGGQFVPHDVLQALIARHQARTVAIHQRVIRQNPFSETVVYLPCPFCKELMLRRNFGKISGIIVDVCGPHGTWFDCGELARILAFVGSGGLEQARVVEANQRQWERSQSQSIAGYAEARHGALSDTDGLRELTLADMQEAAISFARWIREKVGK